MPDKIIVSPRKKIAFVCSGGAAKAAAFHMGVCLALQEKGFAFQGGLKNTKDAPLDPKKFPIDTYIGSSAGSFICSYLVAGYSIEQIFKSYLGKTKGKSPLRPLQYTTLMSVKGSPHEDTGERHSFGKKLKILTDSAINLLYRRKLMSVSGIFSTSGIESYLRNEVLPSNSFKDYAADLYIVATQLNHSKRVIFNKYNRASPPDDATCIYENSVSISDAVAASTALPPIFSPYGIRNHKGKVIYYFDGEIRETLSVHVAEEAGADLIISSYTHQPYHYSKEIGSLTKFGIPSIAIQALYLLIERKIQSAIYVRNQKNLTLEAVNEYCKSIQLDEKHRKKITSILEEKLSIHPDNHYLYIHPRPSDHEMFFGEHFNLSTKFMEKIVRIGFMSAIECLRKYEFTQSSR
jgi:predicted acylesterase/phospholipase RssA